MLFSYPSSHYSSVRFGDVADEGFYTYYLKVRDSDAEDTLTVCKGGLDRCGLDSGAVKPYWFDDGGSLVLFSSTTSVKKQVVAPGDVVYEAFPACPATDNEGASAYGGGCYELVMGSPNKTLSITYWIGPKSFHRSRSRAIEQAKDILRSVVMK
ncbi:hypothetical protein GWC77_02710 [Paraburkholderia sp. NMBU_R16]|uniref:hypothetical protein n=1 Tax=Paraburkholderia sp. NMBU_R16 TaxID=2698676 RepID=UPI00156514F7|nr:hypothetical protein [Paraburkholderia sp. NMBU_R16]NRO94858.1 hypothetical protein [Paraburkholderia sp. NMBU_R16]